MIKGKLPGPTVGLQALWRAMGSSVFFENFVVEVFYAEAQPGDSYLPNSLELALVERPGLAFERNLLGIIPPDGVSKPVDQASKLFRAQVGRRPAAEIHKLKRPAADPRQLLVQLGFTPKRAHIPLDLLAVLVGVDPEVTELAPLTTEGNVEIEPYRRPLLRSGLERAQRRGKMLFIPE